MELIATARVKARGGGWTTFEAVLAELARIRVDPDAFEEFYRDHIEAVQRFVARRVSDPYLAADLTAEVFLAAIESAHTYRAGRGAPVAWLYGVARNVLAAERRRAARSFAAVSRVSGRRLVDDNDIGRLEDRIDAETVARRLYEAMDRLSEGERAVLELVALEGLCVTDVAGALGIRSVTAPGAPAPRPAVDARTARHSGHRAGCHRTGNIMNADNPLTNFERRLLTELRDVVTEYGNEPSAPPDRTTGRCRLVVAAAAVVTGVALAIGALPLSGDREAPVPGPGSPTRMDSWTLPSTPPTTPSAPHSLCTSPTTRRP